jgi:glycosyltransferase involved in cell wall biosynthesis
MTSTKGSSGAQLDVMYLIDGLGFGGAERSFAELLPWYLSAGVRLHIVCMREYDTVVADRIRSHGCEIHVLTGGFWRQVRGLRRLLGDKKPALLHTTLFESDVMGRVAAVGTGVPVLTSLVNTTYDSARLEDPNVGRLGLWVTKTIDGWTARHLTNHFHAITEAVKESSVRSLGVPSERVTVIGRGRSAARLGAPSPDRRLEARRRLGIPADAEVVLNVARQDYQKGQKHLLEAAAVLSASRSRFLLLIAGRQGHASNELTELGERLSLGDRIRMLGNREDVPEILAAADVFAFPSLYEGLGGALIEAMALGLPIVASDLPAVREVVEDGRNALLVRPGSGADLAAALGRLLDDGPLRAAFGARSSEIFVERFTIERSAEQMIALYRQVTGFSGRNAGTAARSGAYAAPLAEPIERLNS